MSRPHPLEVFIPVVFFGGVGYLVAGPFAAGAGVVVGAAIGTGFGNAES